MARGPTRRDFIHQMSATLAVVSATYRSVSLGGLVPAAAISGAEMTWLGSAFELAGELAVLRKYAFAALHDGDSNTAFDWLLAAVSLVDAPISQYRDALHALRAVCTRSGRARAETTIDWYLDRPTDPSDAFDSASTRLARGDALTAGILFERAGLSAHAGYACEVGGAAAVARAHYGVVARTGTTLARGLAVVAAARLSAPSPARDRAVSVAVAHTRSCISPTAYGREILRSLDEHAFSSESYVLAVDPRAERFRFVTAPPWVQPMLDAELAGDIPRTCASMLLNRARLEARVSPPAADFALRRWMLTRLTALEAASATGERQNRLREALTLRLSQVDDDRLLGVAADCAAAA
jgi:hypothetical protein